MKTKLILASAIVASTLMAQTNSPISVYVEVPSITISFPGSMTPNEIGKVLTKLYGTNLAFTFTITNSQNHRFIKFTGNTMPSVDELRQSIAAQRGYQATNVLTVLYQTNDIASGQSDTLTAFRMKFPQFANIPDGQVVLTIGKNFPVYLQKDKIFAKEFAKYSAVERQSFVPDSNNDVEERKAAALERQADALERQADALENQTLAQERAADVAEDQAFQQEMLNDDIDLRLDTLQIQNTTSPLTTPTLPIIPIAPIQQSDHPRFIIVPGQGTYVVSPERPGQPQMITGPGINGPIIVSP